MDPDGIPRCIVAAAQDLAPISELLPQFLLVALLFILGGFFSGSETALSNCNRVRLRARAEDGDAGAAGVLKILDRFDKAIITLLIGTNVIHVIATASATLLAIELLGGQYGPATATVIMTLLVFIFSETIPKSIAKANSDRFAIAISGVLYMLMFILTPIALLFMGFGNLAKYIFRAKQDEPTMTEDDFHSMLESIEDEGVLEADESELIQSAMEFKDTTVEEVLTPRVHIVGIDIEETPEKIRQKILEEKFSRMPVYRHDNDHIIGILNTKIYLQQLLTTRTEQVRVEELMTEPYFVSQNMCVHPLIEELRRRKTHIAIVRDKWGGTLGMVTMEDLLEELVGDIWDEDEVAEAEAAAQELPAAEAEVTA